MKRYKSIFKETKDLTKQYKGFKVLNKKTKETTDYPYRKGVDHKDVETQAIKEQAQVTGQPISDFIINGFIQK